MKDKGIVGEYVTVYFGSWSLSGKVEHDTDDRLIITGEGSGETTLIFKSAVSAITLIDITRTPAQEEREQKEEKPMFSQIKSKNKMEEKSPAQQEEVQEQGMYIPLTVLKQEPDKINPFHSDDFSTIFVGSRAIDFTTKE